MPKSRRHLLLLEEHADIRATFVTLFECVYDFALHVATEARLAIGITGRQNVAVAVVNTHGSMVYYERMDNTQSASARIAVDKGSAAAMYRRTTRQFADAINKSGPAVMTLPGVVASPGGLPIMRDGKVIGGLGVSGMTGDQDEQCAKAGLASAGK